MLKRLLAGLVLGAVLGAMVAAALVQGFGIGSFAVSGAVHAYLAAAVVGVVTGLVAGKPIWARDGRIEAGLKAFFGALLALGAMFALRQWVHLELDLSALRAGSGEIGDLPAAALPLIAAVLGGFFELDNSGDGEDSAKVDEKEKKLAAPGRKVRVAREDVVVDEESVEDAPAAKKTRR
jgi:hypothetical protein